MRHTFAFGAALGLSILGGLAVPAPASVIWTGAQGDLAASAEFNASGNDLIVTLTNTSPADALVPADMLLAVFFDIQSDPSVTLTPNSAILGPGSTVHFGITDPGNSVGGEWFYNGGLSGAPGGAGYGIGAAGFGLFGPGDAFGGNNLSGPVGPDGLDYAITSAGDDVTTGNAPVTGDNPLIQNAVVFTLSGLPGGFDPAPSISNVSFQYGTSLTEPNVPGVPEPGVAALLLVGVAVLLTRRRLSQK